MKFLKKIISVIYVTLLIAMGGATFVESYAGTDYVHQDFYGAPWFAWLWFFLVVFGVIYIIMCIVKRRERRVPVILLHLSFVVILFGAMITQSSGRSGTIHLRLGEPQNIAEITHRGKHYSHRLNFSVELTDFQIIEDEEGNVKDFRSEFTVFDDSIAKSLSVSMNNIATYGNIRFYQMSYDYDLRGSTLMINRDPYGIPVTYCGYVLLFVCFIALCLKKGNGKAAVTSRSAAGSLKIWLPTVALTALWCVYYFVLDGSWSQIPVLRHPLLIFHVVIIILAYALLLIQTISSAAHLIRLYMNPNSPMLATPPTIALLRPALCLLSIGIFLGAIWANISWGNYWSWDPKETWALITLLLYAVPLHQRSLPAFRRPRIFHFYMLLAFLAVLMTYFGVNYCLSGMHSYA